MPELGGLLRRPLITVERVRVCKRDGELLERPHALPGTDEHGLSLWQKLMVYTSEAARHDGQPIHRALIRALRAIASRRAAPRYCAGSGDSTAITNRTATSCFSSAAMSRRSPSSSTPRTTSPNLSTSIDEFTREQGLVTSEMVPAAGPVDGDDRDGGTRMARHDY